MYLYVNGVQVNSTIVSRSLTTTTNNISIGADDQNSIYYYYINGKIEDVRIYKYDMSLTEISSIVNSNGQDNMYYELVSRWLLNEYPAGVSIPAGYSVKDLVNNLDCQGTNSPKYSSGKCVFTSPY